MTKSLSFSPGTYTFSWAYAPQTMFHSMTVCFLCGRRRKPNPGESCAQRQRRGDTSGPSPGTLVLGSYGTVPCNSHLTFPPAVIRLFCGLQLNDTVLDPIFYVSGATAEVRARRRQPPRRTHAGDSTPARRIRSVFDTASRPTISPRLRSMAALFNMARTHRQL